jgi:hypothetical protein
MFNNTVVGTYTTASVAKGVFSPSAIQVSASGTYEVDFVVNGVAATTSPAVSKNVYVGFLGTASTGFYSSMIVESFFPTASTTTSNYPVGGSGTNYNQIALSSMASSFFNSTFLGILPPGATNFMIKGRGFVNFGSSGTFAVALGFDQVLNAYSPAQSFIKLTPVPPANLGIGTNVAVGPWTN